MNGNQSKATRLTTSVLDVCRLVDGEAIVVDVVRSLNGTLVRVKPSSDALAHALHRAIRSDLPLATSAVIESVLSGSCELQVVVPDAFDARAVALRTARASTAARLLHRLSMLLVLASVASYTALLARVVLP